MTSRSHGIAVLISHREPLVRAGLQAAMHTCADVATCLISQDRPLENTDLRAIDVVITDWECGLEVARLPRADRPPVVIVTNDSGEASIRAAMDAGANGYLLLDSSLESVARAVACVAGGGTALDPVAATKMLYSFKTEQLTDRELEVMSLVMQGWSDKLIARQLGIAMGTVKCHLKHLLGKLNARSRTHAAAIAQQRGMLRASNASQGPLTILDEGGEAEARPQPNLISGIRAIRNPR